MINAFCHLCRLFLAGLFLFAAAAKIATRNDIVESYFTNVPGLLESVFSLPAAWGLAAAWFVIVVEIAAAILLLVGRTAKVGAAATGLMLVGFAIFALYYRFGLGNEQGLECGCFGGFIKSQLGVSTAVRNLALLIPVTAVLWEIPTVRSSVTKQLSANVDGRLFATT